MFGRANAKTDLHRVNMVDGNRGPDAVGTIRSAASLGRHEPHVFNFMLKVVDQAASRPGARISPDRSASSPPLGRMSSIGCPEVAT